MDEPIFQSYVPPVGGKLALYIRLEEEFRQKGFEEGREPLFMPEELQDAKEWKNFFHWKMLKLALEEQIGEEYLAMRAGAQEKGTLEKFLASYGQLESHRGEYEAKGAEGLEEFLEKLRGIEI